MPTWAFFTFMGMFFVLGLILGWTTKEWFGLIE